MSLKSNANSNDLRISGGGRRGNKDQYQKAFLPPVRRTSIDNFNRSISDQERSDRQRSQPKRNFQNWDRDPQAGVFDRIFPKYYLCQAPQEMKRDKRKEPQYLGELFKEAQYRRDIEQGLLKAERKRASLVKLKAEKLVATLMLPKIN